MAAIGAPDTGASTTLRIEARIVVAAPGASTRVSAVTSTAGMDMSAARAIASRQKLSNADVSGTPIARGNYRLWGELGTGASMMVGERLFLFAEVSANTAIKDFGKSYGFKGEVSLRLAF